MPNPHPILVHFTIGLFVIAVIFDLLAHFTNKKSLENAGWWNLLFSAAFSVIAVATGLSAEETVPHVDEVHKIIETHETLGLITMGIIIVLVLWRSLNRTELPHKFRIVYLALGLAGLMTITAGGYFGGEMVYRFGVGVTPIDNQLQKYESENTDPSSSVPTGKYYCPMHPEYVSDSSGTCPECGMTLVKKESGHSGHSHNEASEKEHD